MTIKQHRFPDAVQQEAVQRRSRFVAAGSRMERSTIRASPLATEY